MKAPLPQLKISPSPPAMKKHTPLRKMNLPPGSLLPKPKKNPCSQKISPCSEIPEDAPLATACSFCSKIFLTRVAFPLAFQTTKPDSIAANQELTHGHPKMLHAKNELQKCEKNKPQNGGVQLCFVIL